MPACSPSVPTSAIGTDGARCHTRQVRVWVIRGGDHNRLVDDFVDRGEIGLVYPQVPNVRSVDRWEIDRRLDEVSAPPARYPRSMETGMDQRRANAVKMPGMKSA